MGENELGPVLAILFDNVKMGLYFWQDEFGWD